jgi:ribosomal protein S18 acetylase RimI-like enzyme
VKEEIRNMLVERGTVSDIEELALLYDELNDYLAKGKNYPGWKKGIYPTRHNAIQGIADGTLYVARSSGKIAGSIILNHNPETAYHDVTWGIDAEYSDIVVIHTFVVHPAYLKKGIGKSLMDFTTQQCINECMKSIRLDVYENNIPAINLYEKCGFMYMGTVDLGLGMYGLNNFRLYEKVL